MSLGNDISKEQEPRINDFFSNSVSHYCKSKESSEETRSTFSGSSYDHESTGTSKTGNEIENKMEYRSYLSDLNYVKNNLEYLNEATNFETFPNSEEEYNDYLEISPELIPGYVLIQQIKSEFQQSRLIYHAIKKSTEEKYLIRISPALSSNLSISEFLNEWYILSGLNVPKQHRLWMNGSLENSYLHKETRVEFNHERPDLLSPITLPKGIPGILYPFDFLNVSSPVSGDGHTQKRFALIYKDYDYKPLKYFSVVEKASSQEPREANSCISIDSSSSSHSINYQSLGSNSLLEEFAKKTKQTAKSPLKVVEILSDIITILKALLIAHEFGVVHNGITSHNILKSESNPNNVVLSGWNYYFSMHLENCSKDFRNSNIKSAIGLLPYMSPEAINSGRLVDYRSDFYSIGIVLYELIVGCLPFKSETSSKLIRMHVLQKPIAPHLVGQSWISEDLSNIILKLLEKTPMKRYHDCGTLINDLLRVKNSYIDGISEMGEPVFSYWSNLDKTKGHLIKSPPLNLDKCGIPPPLLSPIGLFGMSEEYKEITEIYNSSNYGICLISISGEMGVGKSTLLGEIHFSAISKFGYNCSWTFNQFESEGSTYKPFLTGIKSIIKQIKICSNETIAEWRDLISSKIPFDLSILFYLIPELKELLGPKYANINQSKKDFLSINSESVENNLSLELKFRYIIKVFYSIVASKGLDIFLDDFQWSTSSEIEMLAEILEFLDSNNDDKPIAVKFVAAHLTENDYMNNSNAFLQKFKERDIKIFNFELKKLNSDEFMQWVSVSSLVESPFMPKDFFYNGSLEERTSISSMINGKNDIVTYSKDPEIELLTSRLYNITKGNVLFNIFLFRTAFLEGNVIYENGRAKDDKKWRYRIDKDSSQDMSKIIKDYIDLAIPKKARVLLKFAALIENFDFNLVDLVTVSNMPIKEVFNILNLCLETKIFIPTSPYYKLPFHLMTSSDFTFDLSDSNVWKLASMTSYRFSHHSLKRKIMKELSETNELMNYYRLCGLRYYKTIVKGLSPNITRYLIMAKYLYRSWEIAKSEEKEIYCKVLILAGRFASSTYNMKTSLMFFETADKFIEESNTKRRFKSVMTICQSRFLLEQFDSCLNLIEETQRKHGFDETSFLIIRIGCLFRLGRDEEGTKVAIEGLRKLGIEIYEDDAKCKISFYRLMKETPLSVSDIRRLKELKPSTDPKIKMIFKLISDFVSPANMVDGFYLKKLLEVQLISKMTEFGVTSSCAIPLLDYANYLAKEGNRNSFLKAIELCQIALFLIDNDDHKVFTYVQSVYEFYINTLAVYIEPVSDVVKYFDTFIYSAKLFSMHSSSMEGVTSCSKIHLLYLAGKPLKQMMNISTKNASAETLNHYELLMSTTKLLQDKISIQEMEDLCLCSGSITYQFTLEVVRIMYMALHGNFNDAAEVILNRAFKLSEDLPLNYVHIEFYFLAIVALSKSSDSKDIEKKAVITRLFRQFEIWDEICPSTFAAKTLIIKAQMIQPSPNSLEILDLYEEAIEIARKNNNWYDLSWGSYFCAIWLAESKASFKRTSTFIEIALKGFEGLDVMLAVNQIKSRFSYYLSKDYNWAGVANSEALVNKLSFNNDSRPLSKVLQSFFQENSNKTQHSHLQPDLVTNTPEIQSPKVINTSYVDHLNNAIKSCLTISDSSSDESILLNLLESTILFSAADYGVIAINKKSEFFIQAIGSPNNIYTLNEEPLSSRTDLCPFSLIMHVITNGEIVNKDNDRIFFQNHFGKDNYHVHNKCYGSICIPLKTQFEVFGALYLERQIKVEKSQLPFFDDKKKDILNLLCTQAAVSIGKSRLYSQMKIAKRAAEDATREKASFLANMSHEIRTPFNSLLSCSIFLLDTELNLTQRDYVETIKNSAMLTLNIIDSILTFSKIEHGSFTLENLPFSLNDCIESAILLAGEQASANGIELVFFNRCPDIDTITGDITRFRQIIINLVGNAVKFTTKGKIIVECLANEIAKDRYRISISVEDTGIGIPDEAKCKIFGAFSQVDGSSRRKFGGSGLGLAISKKLSDLMGGILSFDTEYGKGSTFHFTIPAQVRLREKKNEVFDPVKLKSEHKNNIVIVFNYEFGKRALKESLEYLGFTVSILQLREALESKAEFPVMFLEATQFESFKNHNGDLKLRCKVILIAQFGKPLSLEMEKFPILLCPFQKSKLIQVLSSSLNYCEKTKKPLLEQNKEALLSEKFPLNILIAEDNLINIKVAIQHLKKLGYQADHAKDGVEVIEKCKKLLSDSKKYDVILMDIQMPRKDGISATIELKEWLLSEGKEEYLPDIIALTANVAGEDKERSLESGMIDFIAKPILPNELKRVLINVGKRKRIEL